MEKNIWLSKEGAMSGPFSETEIGELRASGELARYGWIWSMDTGQWAPVHPRPVSAPVFQKATTPVTAPASAPRESASILPASKPSFLAAQVTTAASVAPARPLAVICHDQRNVVSGMVQSLRDGGCMVTSEQGLDALPLFRKGARISINLLDEAMDRAENVEATVASVRKDADPERWCYDLDWAQRPEILKGNS
jgi:hypothetical protein